MPLKYNPKGAPSVTLAKVMASFARICREQGVMASLVISDGHHSEFFLSLDPSWSCCSMKRLPSGDIQVSVNTAGQKDQIEKTTTALAGLFQLVNEHRGNLASVMSDLQKALAYRHFGEECHRKTDDPPDPTRIPETLEEAAELIYATMNDDQLTYAKVTPLYAALPHLHMGFAMQLRNSWKLWEKPCPLAEHVKKRLGLFGHADDLSILIFTRLWDRVRGISEGVAEHNLCMEAEGMKAHWQKTGVNPETGEKGLIV